MGNRVFDEQFKKMAVELSTVNGSVKTAASELEMDPSLLSKWRNDPRYNGGHIIIDKPGLSEEEQKIRRLEKELKEAKIERDILKSFYSGSACGIANTTKPEKSVNCIDFQ